MGFDGVEACYSRSNPPTEKTLKQDGITLEHFDIKALTVQWADDYCDYPDPVAGFKECVKACKALGAKVLTLNAWVPNGLTEKEKFDYYQKLWTQFGQMAGDAGLKIGIENCPHGGRNFASCPENFQRMFDLVPDETIGLEFDPSHYVFQFIPYLPSIREFGDRIYAVHAKDTQILHDRLNRVGIYGNGWWHFRIPGYGDVDWNAFFIALNDIKYDGDIIIEHEDPTYGVHEGLQRGAKFLMQFIL